MLEAVINGKKVICHSGETILEVLKTLDIEVPTLCHDERLKPEGACRLCIVEVEGEKNLVCSCSTPIKNNMVIQTHSDRVVEARRETLSLLLSDHHVDCITCRKSGECKLQDYCYEYDVDLDRYTEDLKKTRCDYSNKFYYKDDRKCILCGKCINVCKELQGSSILDFIDRGFETHVGPAFDMPLEDTDCVSCGNCVSVCPTGALMPKDRIKFRYWETKKVRTTCVYCGVGCQMDLVVKDQKIVEVQPAKGKPNDGLLCVKGKFAYNFVNHPDRLKKPLLKKDGAFVEITWDEAISIFSGKIKEVKAAYGADAIAGLSSARCTNEENYLFQKLFRAVIGNNNVDHCARLCHASTVAGLAKTYGSGAMTNSIEEVDKMGSIFVIGSNTTETHPIIGAKIKRQKKKGAKLIVADPRSIELSKYADVYLQIRPGTNIALVNGMMHYIIENNLHDQNYINDRTEGYEDLVVKLKDYTIEKVAGICEVDPELIKKAARLYAEADCGGIFYSMGVTQHSTGTNGVMSISNLAAICGNVGIEGGGVNPLRGQNNVQGACDMGALPGDFPGYQKVNDPLSLEKFEKAWQCKLSDRQGLVVSEMLDNAAREQIKVMYIMGENPMISDPDINHVKLALEKTGFLVVQDIFMSETAALADLVLPAASFAEKDGTFTNTERRVQRIRKAIEPIGDVKADWEILSLIMNALDYKNDYNNAEAIMAEISRLTPQYGGISYTRIEKEGLQWPCRDENDPGTKYLHQDKFVRGKAALVPVDYTPSDELPDQDYPLILTTGRILYHYHTRTMTGKIEGLNEIEGKSFIEINPKAAEALELQDKEVIQVVSRRGKIKTIVRITVGIKENVVFIPFHFADGAANYLTNTKIDDIAKIPELKVCAVRLEKLEKANDADA